ncbi:hypothetical protein [Amycolatopsis sp. CA-230715]|uniref:hypothetical protein n=1 Tax=Amycolatopsis sp. CA-230715 TaxID=2745196 RepID=UPI001C3304A8|nr:hypothetical protein [Amycolatopsis sp. CA-230715]QWF78232.1 hypothetical protein HUW46_01627 [Amycolatopsis sp. CA-230715]
MKLRKVAGCKDGECPTAHLSDRGTVVLQGNAVVHGGVVRLGPGEQAVELPLDVVRSAIPALEET